MAEFINGMELCRRFFDQAAAPILRNNFPELVYTAGLIGYGSDVLGYDDEISTDHMWGPRFYLFLSEGDIGLSRQIMSIFSKQLPPEFLGYSVNFSTPDPNDNGIRHSELSTNGTVSPLIFIQTFKDYISGYMGVKNFCSLSATDWLAFSEHKLLSLTCGKLFHDGLNLGAALEKISFYPDDVKLYLIASNWSLIAEEQAFVKRCHDVGDEIGSVLACSRIVERLMRLSFLYCEKYAPYSKWFGTAFKELPVSDEIKTAILNAVAAKDISTRENNIVKAQKLLADLHNSLAITEFVDVEIQNYFGREIKVIFADRIANAAIAALAGTVFEHFPFIGTMSEVSNFVTLSDNPAYRKNIKSLYCQN